MNTSRVFGLLGLWLMLGLAVVWTETCRLRVHQSISRLHEAKVRALETRARCLLALHRQMSPAALLSSIERNGVSLRPPSCSPAASQVGEPTAGADLR